MKKHILLSVLILNSIVLAKAQNQPSGKALFENNCAQCHGNDGTKGRWGAKNLRASKLDDAAILNMISNGRGFMPNWSKKLPAYQIQLIAKYIKTLRAN